jgi:hypothetical protein
MRAIRTRPDGHDKEKTSWADGLGRKGFTLAGLEHLDLSDLPGAVRIAPGVGRVPAAPAPLPRIGEWRAKF